MSGTYVVVDTMSDITSEYPRSAARGWNIGIPSFSIEYRYPDIHCVSYLSDPVAYHPTLLTRDNEKYNQMFVGLLTSISNQS